MIRSKEERTHDRNFGGVFHRGGKIQKEWVCQKIVFGLREFGILGNSKNKMLKGACMERRCSEKDR